MITKFTELNDVTVKGGCFTENTALPGLLKNHINIVYGKNGSGKSSISRAIQAGETADNDTCEYCARYNDTLNDDIKKRIFVFNENFIDECIKIQEDGLNTIVMLGEQVKNDKIIKSNTIAIKEKQQKLNGKSSLYKEKSENNEMLFSILKKTLQEDKGWADNDKRIKGNSTKTKVKPDTIKELFETRDVADGEQISNIEFENKIRLIEGSREGVMISNRIQHIAMSLSIDEIDEVVSKHIEKDTLTTRDEKILQFSLEHGLVNLANEYFGEVENYVCPFCLQKVDADVKERIFKIVKELLHKESEMLKARLKEIQARIGITKFSIPEKGIMEIAGEMIAHLDKITGEINNKWLVIKDVIQHRINNIYNEMSDAIPRDITRLYDEYNICADKINARIDEYNKSILQRESFKAELINENKCRAYKGLKDSIDKYIQIEESKKAIHKEMDELNNEIQMLIDENERLIGTNYNVDVSVKLLNKYLAFIFYDDKRIRLVNENGCYSLRINNMKVVPAKVSAGERNAIALCYFFVALAQGKTEKNRYDEQMLVVLDDPISSFDHDNKIGIIAMIRWQISYALSSCSDSKFLILSHDISTVFDLVKVADDIIDNSKENLVAECSAFKLDNNNLDVIFKKYTERNKILKYSVYLKLLEQVYMVAAAESETPGLPLLNLGNSIRRVLEAYSTFVHLSGPMELFHNTSLLNGVDKDESLYYMNSMSRLFFNDDSHMAEKAKSLHLIDAPFSFSERQRMARVALKFLTAINRQHVESYLKERMPIIDSWEVVQE